MFSGPVTAVAPLSLVVVGAPPPCLVVSGECVRGLRQFPLLAFSGNVGRAVATTLSLGGHLFGV